MDPTFAALLGAMIGALGTLATTAYLINQDKARRVEEHRWAEEQDLRARRYELDQRKIHDTRAQLLAYIDAVESAIDQDLSMAKGQFARAEDAWLADALLLGDLDAAVAWAEALSDVFEHVPTNTVGWVLARLSNPISRRQRDALREARALVVLACVRQVERIASGEPLAVITTEEFRKRITPERTDAIAKRLA